MRTRHSSRVIYAFQCFLGTLSSIPFVIGHVRIAELTNGMILLSAAAFGLLGQVAMNHMFRFICVAEGSTLLMGETALAAMVECLYFRNS